MDEQSGSAPRFHLIGHLQSNKAARAAELFDGVDSLDSVRLAERLNEAAGRFGKRLPVLIEVKLSPEETKTGVEPESEEAARLLERLPDLEHLETRGLMTIAPWGAPEDVTRACFRSLRVWRDRWAAAHPKLNLEVLSMGMSGDFALAIARGRDAHPHRDGAVRRAQAAGGAAKPGIGVRLMLRAATDGVTLAVRAQPGAKKTAIVGIYGEGAAAQLKIAVQAPPLEGRANAALIAFLAGTFGLPKSAVELGSGELSRSKVFLLRGVAMAHATALLAQRIDV